MRRRPRLAAGHLLLAERDLAILAAAAFVSVLGDAAALIALTLRLHAEGGGGWLIAALLFAGSAPMVLLSPVAGAVADRVDSRTVIVGSALAQAACALGLAAVHGTAETLALTALLTTAGTLVGPATGALVPHTVPADRLVQAGALMQTAFVLGNLAGPPVGGLLTGLWGSRAPLALDAVSFLVVAVAVTAVRTRRQPHGADGGTVRKQSGLRLILRDTVLRPVVTSMTVLVLVSASVNVAEVFLFKDALHTTDAVYGIASASWMLGMVAGSALTPRFGQDGRVLLAVMAVSELVVCAGLVAAGVSPVWPIAVGAFVIGGVGNGALSVACRTIIVLRVPDEVRGRVLGVFTGAINAASVVAFGAGGALVSMVGPRPTVVACGVAGLAVGTAFTIQARAASRNPDTVPEWPALMTSTEREQPVSG